MRLVEGGAFAGFDVEALAIARGAGAQIARLRLLGVRTSVVTDRPRMRPADLLRATAAAAGRLRRDRPAALILSLPQANIVGRLASYAARPPAVASFEHNTRLAKPVYERLFRATSGAVDWMLADCEATARGAADRLYRRPPARTFVLPLVGFPSPSRPPLALPPWTPEAGRPFRIVNAGRLTAVKNQAGLIDAAARLTREGLPVELILYGDGPERVALEARAAGAGLGGLVLLPGHVADWAERPADLYVMPSRHEGLAISLLQAMHAGLPCAATFVGGVADYGQGGAVERLVDGESSTVAQTIFALARDPERRLGLIERGRASVMAAYGETVVQASYAAFNAALHAEVRRSGRDGAPP